MGSKKRITVHVNRDKKYFQIDEYNGTLTVSRIAFGWVSNDLAKIGQTKSLKDAIELIKASVDGTVGNIEIVDE